MISNTLKNANLYILNRGYGDIMSEHNTSKFSESTFRIPGCNICILSDCICVYGEGNKYHIESGNCMKCQIPMIMKEEARKYLISRMKRSLYGLKWCLNDEEGGVEKQ